MKPWEENTITEPIKLWEEENTPNVSRKITEEELTHIEEERDRQGALNTGPLDTVILIHSEHRPLDPPMPAEIWCRELITSIKRR